MSVHGSVTENPDKSKDFAIGVVSGNSYTSLSATAMVKGYKDEALVKPGAPNYKAAIGNITAQSSGHGASLTAEHFPRSANSVTAAASVNVLHRNDHKIDVNGFVTHTMPKSGPNFTKHGAGVDYMYKDTIGAAASVSSVPMFKHTESSVMGKLHLNQTPNSSLSFNAGVTKTQNPFSNNGWQPGGVFIYKRSF